MKIREYTKEDEKSWNEFVHKNSHGNIYHLAQWKEIIEKTYSHKAYYFICEENEKIRGILPLVHLNHFLFGNKLISIPYFDMAGPIADGLKPMEKLISKAVETAESLGAQSVEFRYESIEKPKEETLNNEKTRMVASLCENSEDLWKSYNSKLRNKIKRTFKSGLEFKIGGAELLDDYYDVFCVNMRDLGSPVHSKKLFKNIFKSFEKEAVSGVVYKDNQPVSGIICMGFKNIFFNPWSSSLKEFRNLNANTLQYWKMLEYAADTGHEYFDFGRSTPGEGTYEFKRKWGAESKPLFWDKIELNEETESEKERFGSFVKIWQKLPVKFTKIAGPPIRKNIGL